MSDDRIVPNCYHVSSSSPQETAANVRECVRQVGGPGRPPKLATNGTKVYSLVYYRTKELAAEYLDAITSCLQDKGHVVHEAEVLEDIQGFEEFGFDVEDYPPESPTSA
jgi:hypothetical protein